MCDFTPATTVTLAKSVQAPGMARAFVRQAACPEHAEQAEAAVELLVSELVTNAVLHGESPIWLEIQCAVHEVRVGVHDGDKTKPVQMTADGMGLLLVDKVARDWGTDLLDDGKAVWCVVPTGCMPQQHPVAWATARQSRSPVWPEGDSELWRQPR